MKKWKQISQVVQCKVMFLLFSKTNILVKRKYDDTDESSSENDEQEVTWLQEDLSESEPDLECEIWDDDTVLIPKQKRQNALLGCNISTTFFFVTTELL